MHALLTGPFLVEYLDQSRRPRRAT